MAGIIVTLDRLDEYPWGAYLPEILETGCVDMIRINTVRWNDTQLRGAVEVIQAKNRQVLILFDLGQKLRVYFPKGYLVPKKGKTLCIYLRPDEKKVCLNYNLYSYQFPSGQHVVMHDGKLQGEIIENTSESVTVRFTYVHEKTTKVDQLPGIYFPGLHINRCCIGLREEKVLRLASELGIDSIATSFVETDNDIKNTINAFPQGFTPNIVAKIETERGVENIDTIISSFPPRRGMIMIARGDLFVEAPSAQLGYYQRHSIESCKKYDVPFIVATGILQGMRWNSEPTRAEVIDVDTAVRAGATYLMLCEETAKDAVSPLKVIQMLYEIIRLAK